MLPRERVLSALAHEKTDHPPFQASFVPELAARLRQQLGLPPVRIHDPHCERWNGYELEIATHQDALTCSVGWVGNYYLDDKPYVDDWHVGWGVKTYTTPYGPGFYTEIKRHPLSDASALASYQPPDPNRPELYVNTERLVREYGSDYYIIGRLNCTIFETAWALRGFQQMLLDMVEEPELTDEILEIVYQYHRVVAHRLAERGVDMIWLGDDVGSQKYMLISPGTWRKFFKQRMATLIAEAKAINPALKIAYHSDGAIQPIIPELIEIGVDVLNPIQPESMNPAELKQKYGDRLCFFGAIDVQNTLPFGTPETVAAEYRERLATIGENGGWLCAPTHHVQADTPLENLWALVDAIQTT